MLHNFILVLHNFPLSITISFNEASSGVACNLESRGFKVLCKATEDAVGHVKPYSITGTLPLIRELQVSIHLYNQISSFSFRNISSSHHSYLSIAG